MRNRKQITRIFALLLAAPLLLTGCSGASTASEPEETAAVTEATTEPPTTEPPTTEAPTEPPVVLDRDMTLEEKIYQMFIVTPEALTGVGKVQSAGDSTKAALDERHVGGLIYFGDNLRSFGQTQDMLENTQDFALSDGGLGVFLAVDEEGGTVARCGNKLGTSQLEPMEVIGGRNNPEEAVEVGQTLGRTLSVLGFNVDFAPVADVNLNPANELGDRIFSTNPEVVGNMVNGVVSGIQENNKVAATLKHFPGLGAADGNTHEDGSVVIDRTLDQLREAEFVSFERGIEAGADFVMVTHAKITGVNDDLPSSLSPVVCTELLRDELGFQGIIITDSMQMNTISANYDAGEAAVLAIEAGADIILMPSDFSAAVAGVQEAVESGRISENRINQSVKRILDEKKKLGIYERIEEETESTEEASE
ncbi:MAG: glycoside hydrolase family 3 protein [Oscillospiraceae bacterium]|nr:glycoside hydrolase family 3 protein [Oscillospiraceae bacterium]